MSRQVWIGMLQVEPRAGNELLDGAAGAFVNALAIADDAAEWLEKTRIALDDRGFEITNAEDVEPFWARENAANPSEQLRDEAEQVRLTGEVRFGSFQAFGDSQA